jgi:electron transfer flavoprotein alpha subunit
MKKILLYLDGNRAQELSLFGACERMVAKHENTITAIGTTENIPTGNSLYDEVIKIDDSINAYDTLQLTELLEALHHQHQYDIILFPATSLGRILAPRLAIALHTGLVADVTDIVVNNDVIEMVRPAYSGKLMAQIVSTSEGPLMMTVRSGVFTSKTAVLKTTQYHRFSFVTQASRISLLETQAKPTTKDIRDSKVLISGGGGVLEHFDHLHELASVLNAQVAASRRVVDSGVVQRKIQVGQSGKTVSPKLYIALGISGSVQHIEGLKNVETIIAVNTNKHAPICSLATIVVEGDAVAFIERLLNKIKNNSLNFKEETQ